MALRKIAEIDWELYLEEEQELTDTIKDVPTNEK